jgi:heme/copper-type cytochrome/quinol oxidase subunit 3
VADHAASHAVAHAVHDPNIGNTGLDHRKMGMWAFLGSDCMFFGSLIGTYLAYKGKSISGPTPHDVFDIPLTSYSAALLLASSLTMVLALAALQDNRVKVAAGWLLATAAMGLHFVLNQVYEFWTFVFHHAGLYWHFVDIVWIAIFTIIYLIP